MEWVISLSTARRRLENISHIRFHTIPVITFLAIVAIRLSGIDSGAGFFCGFLAFTAFALSVAAWLVVFFYAMLIYAVLNKHWLFLFVAMPLLVARILWASEVFGNDSSDTFYIWLPVEHILYYLVIHRESKLGKIGFFATTAVLYGLCCLTLVIAYKVQWWL